MTEEVFFELERWEGLVLPWARPVLAAGHLLNIIRISPASRLSGTSSTSTSQVPLASISQSAPQASSFLNPQFDHCIGLHKVTKPPLRCHPSSPAFAQNIGTYKLDWLSPGGT